MKNLRTTFALALLSLIPVSTFATIIIFYFSKDALFIAADGKKTLKKGGIIVDSSMTFCKIQAIDNYYASIAGWDEGTGKSFRGNSIDYNSHIIVDSCLRKYSYDTAVDQITSILRFKLEDMGYHEIRNLYPVESLPVKFNTNEPVLSIAIVSSKKSKEFILRLIKFYYYEDHKIPEIKVNDTLIYQTKSIGSHFEIGEKLHRMAKENLELHIKNKTIDALKKTIQMESDSFLSVGGHVNILKIKKYNSRVIDSTTCDFGSSH